MDDNYLSILKDEFSAEDNSFLLQLRCDLYWDKVAFKRLIEAMYTCCKQYAQPPNSQEREYPLPRWLAEGYWNMDTFVPAHTSHPAWNDIIATEPEYFRNAYRFLHSLASWFFLGSSPWKDGVDIQKYYSVLFQPDNAN
jgi:hypothetical protein